MKTIIFFNDKHKENIDALKSIIEKQDCVVEVYSCDKVWKFESYENPISFLKDATHFLFILNKSPLEVPEFMFYSGYAMGNGIPVLLLSNNVDASLPKSFKNFVVKLDINFFEDYFKKEKKHFQKIKKQSMARALLLEKGYPCFDSNLVLAVESNNMEVVNLYIDAGFTPSTCNTKGTPILSLAVRNGLYEMAELLLRLGADVNQVSEDRLYSALMDASQVGDYRSCELLLSSGANANLQSKDGQTALILAVGRQDAKLTELLIKNGADSKLPDLLGMSAEKYAELFKNAEVLKALKK